MILLTTICLSLKLALIAHGKISIREVIKLLSCNRGLHAGEMIVGPCTALFMDEISTGLDSSTTFSIVKSLGQFTRVMDSTVVISLLQPAPETFDLFDDVILLAEGEQVMSFFRSCGFKCPERKGVADFLQEVTSPKDQEQYWSDTYRPYRYVSVRDFAERFKRFEVGDQMLRELEVPFPKERSHPAALCKKKFSGTNMELFKANFGKEYLLYKRNSIVTIFKTIQVTETPALMSFLISNAN